MTSFNQRTTFAGLGSSGTSQTSVNSTNLSTAFIHLTQRQRQFFDRIIELLPDESSNFSELKRTYNLVRQDSDTILGTKVDQSTDTALWDTLLHLTHVRGKTWAQRWDAVRMSLGLEPLNVSEDDLSGADSEHDYDSSKRFFNDVQPRTHSWHSGGIAKRSNNVDHARSSSNATMESPALLAQGRRQNETNVNRNAIDALRAQMAALKAQTSSLASSIENTPPHPPSHHTNDKSNRKLRFASSEEYFNISKATTVESASDEDESPRQKILRNATTPSSSTPIKRRFDEVVARSKSERDTARKVAEAEQEAANEAQFKPLYDSADVLFAKRLQTKCLSWWITLHRKRDETINRVIEERAKLLRSKAFQSWQLKTEKHIRKQNSAEKIDLIRCKLSAWRTWIRRMKNERKKHREERRMELRGAFEVIRSRMEHKLVQELFVKWRIAWLEERASRFRSEHLLRGTMGLWRIQTWQMTHLRDKEDQVIGMRDGSLIRLAFLQWQHAYKVKDMNEISKSYDLQRVLRISFDKWKLTMQDQTNLHRKEALADRWRNRRMKNSVFAIWKEGTRKISNQKEDAIHFNNVRIRHHAIHLFHHWVLRERENLFVRIASSRMLNMSITKWYERMSNLQQTLLEKERLLIIKRKIALLQRTFTCWQESTFEIVSAQHLAAKRDDRKLVVEAFAVWKRAYDQKAVNLQKAALFDSVCIKRHYFSVWIARKRENQLERHLENRRIQSQRSTFALWRARAQEKRKESLAVSLMLGQIEKRIRGQTLKVWIERVIERKSMFMEAAEARDGLLVHRAWQKWVQACMDHEDMLNLGNSFRDVKQEDWLRKLFTRWNTFARAERIRRERVEQFLIEKRKRMIANVFERWYDQYAESSLHEIELEALMQRQESIKGGVIERWKAKTKSLPAIQLDHVRVQSKAFHLWKENLPFARTQRNAIMHDKLIMQSKAFDHWRKMAKANRAFRAAARFGGPSAVQLRAARRRSSGPPNNIGGIFATGGKTPKRRNRSSNAAVSQDNFISQRVVRPNSVAAAADVSSLRASDLIAEDSDLKDPSPIKPMAHSFAQLTRRHLNLSPERKQLTSSEREKGDNDNSDEIFSEPPPNQSNSRFLTDNRGRNRQQSPIRKHQSRTPSPAASRTQSEATIRIRNSPRKIKLSTSTPRLGITEMFKARRRDM